LKIEHFLNKLRNDGSLDSFVVYIEQCLIDGKTNKNILQNSPVKVYPRILKKVLDFWYPGYSEMSAKERRQWVTKTWPILHMEKTVNWKFKMNQDDPTHPIYKHFTNINIVNYNGQKSMALKRGLEWKFDFLTWIVWWIQTGHFDERGVKNHQYQMCRYNDIGPYSWDNVYCDTGENNKEDYWQLNRTLETVY